MKSERKQIQESNLLADKIEAVFIKVKKLLPAILGVGAVVVVALLGYGFYSSIQEKESAKGWTALYFSDTDASELNTISGDFGNTVAGLWAKQTAGDAYMARALEKVYLDRELSDQYYKQAIDEYKAIAEKTNDAFLKERSLYGLAQASEGLGDREQAITYYKKVAVVPGISPEFLAEVNKRASWLASKSGEQFYDWFKKNRPSAPALQATPPAKLPLPGTPTFNLPPVQPANPSSETPASTTPSSETPSTDTLSVPDANPATDKPQAPVVPTTPTEPPESPRPPVLEADPK